MQINPFSSSFPLVFFFPFIRIPPQKKNLSLPSPKFHLIKDHLCITVQFSVKYFACITLFRFRPKKMTSDLWYLSFFWRSQFSMLSQQPIEFASASGTLAGVLGSTLFSCHQSCLGPSIDEWIFVTLDYINILTLLHSSFQHHQLIWLYLAIPLMPCFV